MELREKHGDRFSTLWEYFTRKETSQDGVVELQHLGGRTWLALLWVDDKKSDFKIIKLKKQYDWYRLPDQHVAIPLIWYIIWGWQQNDTAIGINESGNLCVNHRQSAVMMIGPIPTIGGGGGGGGMSMFERVE